MRVNACRNCRNAMRIICKRRRKELHERRADLLLPATRLSRRVAVFWFWRHDGWRSGPTAPAISRLKVRRGRRGVAMHGRAHLCIRGSAQGQLDSCLSPAETLLPFPEYLATGWKFGVVGDEMAQN